MRNSRKKINTSKYLFVLLSLLFVGCQQLPKTEIAPWRPYDESGEIAKNAEHQSKKMQYKLIQSKVRDKNDIWHDIAGQIVDFSEQDYLSLKPLILNQSIPALQAQVKSGALSYARLTQWYLYRIVKFENDKNKALNSIIAINPNAVKLAREKDKQRSSSDHPVFGMPILLKDNINVQGMPTTAGTHALRDNRAANAFITERIEAQGGIILGKTNLSEWANFLCLGCPNGYSAVGGQTLNPYGARIFDTGGSSSGSGAAMAVNFAAAAVGTETSGSILSPSSKHSLVGLKPTTGLLSRSGIVPISSTLDTPGPMTRNVIDAAILLAAMSGEDPTDKATRNNPKDKKYWVGLESATLKGIRFGVNKKFLEDPLYQQSVKKIVALGGIAVEFEPQKPDLENFGLLLSADMKVDLPAYLNRYAAQDFPLHSVADIVAYNKVDPALRIPYGQARFERILEADLTPQQLTELVARLRKEGAHYFEQPMQTHKLDAVLSINNYNAGHAAAANYPCLTLPMGYTPEGEPRGLTLIARPFEEEKLLQIAYAFEQASKIRRIPIGYQ